MLYFSEKKSIFRLTLKNNHVFEIIPFVMLIFIQYDKADSIKQHRIIINTLIFVHISIFQCSN